MFARNLIVLACALLYGGLASAAPKVQGWHTENGAKVLFVETRQLPMFDVRVVFDAGGARDGDAFGLAALTNELLSQGAGNWDADQLAERLDAVGARFGSGVNRDMAWLSVRALIEPKARDTAIETLAAMLAEPRFGKAAFQRTLRHKLIAERQKLQSAGKVASRAFYHAVYGDHPYAHDPEGVAATLEKLTPAQARAFHRRYYVGANALVVIAGALDRPRAEHIAERLVERLPGGEPATPLPAVGPLVRISHRPSTAAAQSHALTGVRSVRMLDVVSATPARPSVANASHAAPLNHLATNAGEKSGLAKRDLTRIVFPSSQTHLLIGQLGMKRGEPDYFPLYVGNHILGGGGLVSLLSEEVREKRGLAYGAYSYFAPLRQTGPFIAGASTKNAQAREALRVMRDTIRTFIENGPTDAQLKAAKQNLIGGFPRKIASNRKLSEYLAMMGFYDYPLDYLDTFATIIGAVTRERIHAAFKRRFDVDHFVTVEVGGKRKDGG